MNVMASPTPTNASGEGRRQRLGLGERQLAAITSPPSTINRREPNLSSSTPTGNLHQGVHQQLDDPEHGQLR